VFYWATVKKRELSLNLKVHKEVLPNGLTVLIMENHRLPIFSYYTYFDVGGRHEEKGLTGASHYLEHLMFKGAKKYGPGQFDRTIEGNGGFSNAYTTFDNTVYHQNMPKKALEKIIDMEVDRMENLLLDPVAFESERQVVLEERKQRYENRPMGKIFLTMMQSVFEKTPYGGSVIGDVEDIKNVTRDQIFEYFKKFYAPNNAILVIVGDVDTKKTMEIIQKRYGVLKASSKMQAIKKKMNDPELYKHKGRYNRSIHLKGQSPTPLFFMATKGEPLGTRKSYVVDLLSSILGDGASSYLSGLYVINKKPLLASVSVGHYTLKKNGVFYMYGQMLKKEHPEKMKKIILGHMDDFCEKGITERALQKTKNQYFMSYLGGLRSNAGAARFLGSFEFYHGDYRYFQKEWEAYNSINTMEIKRACRDVFKKDQFIFLSIWDKHPEGI
jgi:zinc protease